MSSNTLSVFGLGKLGSSMLVSFAHQGWNVIGVDINENIVEKINQGVSPIEEPLVQEYLTENTDRISATVDVDYAVKSSFASFIVVPTPSMSDGKFSTQYVQKALEDIATALRSKEDYHLIVITSTVLPGDTARLARIVEETSEKKLNVDFGLCYNPDFIALGKVVHDFLYPDMVLIGQSDRRAGDILEGIHRILADSAPPIYKMSWENAELAKISLNSYCTMKITFANVIGEICETMPGGDAEAVLRAIGSDARIGHKYFKPGLAWSGPCFPRDNSAFSRVARDYGVVNTLSETNDAINHYHRSVRILNYIKKFIRRNGASKIAVLGLSYKEDTPVIEESVSIRVVKGLIGQGVEVTVYDPLAMDNAKKELPERVIYADSMQSCIRGQTICFVATPHPVFKTLSPTDIIHSMGVDPVILDAWNIFPASIEGVSVKKIGKNYAKS